MPVSTECAAALLSFRYPSLYIIMIIHSDSTINSSLQGLLSALGKPKSNPVQQVSFYSDKVNKNDTISEHDER